MSGDPPKPQRSSALLDLPQAPPALDRLLVSSSASQPGIGSLPPSARASQQLVQAGWQADAAPVLARLQAFVPALAAANAVLASQPAPSGVEIEAVSEEASGSEEEAEEEEEEEEEAAGEAPHVSMEIACGVLELHDAAAVAAAQAAVEDGPAGPDAGRRREEAAAEVARRGRIEELK